MGECIGLVGFGIMGTAMAARLIDAGYEVTVFDTSRAAMDRARGIGCRAAETPAGIAQARITIVSLPRPEHVVQVVRGGEDCLLAGAPEGSVIVDTSTVDPATSRQNAAAARLAGIGYLDAPILGRPAGVGKWTLPVGGEPGDIETATPVLKTFAARIVHVGPSGQGNVLKLLNNLMFGAINAATCEVFAAAERLGMERALFFDTIAASGAATVSNLFRELGPKIIEHEFTPTFSIDNLEKDIGLGLAMARASGMELEVSEAAQRLNRQAQSAGIGSEDSAAVVKIVGHGATAEDPG